MRTLVLNAGFEPLAVVSFKRALVLVMNQKATVVAADAEHPVWGSSGAYDRPSVILLTRYVRIPSSRLIPVSRRGVLRRDSAIASRIPSTSLCRGDIIQVFDPVSHFEYGSCGLGDFIPYARPKKHQ